MINKTNLIKLAKASPMISSFLMSFCIIVINATKAEDYKSHKFKGKFDKLITDNDVCELNTQYYEEQVKEIYNVLKIS